LGVLKNRLIFQVETRCPSLFYWAKQRAVKQVFKWKARGNTAGGAPIPS
jgi:hypothetical protein